MERIQHAAFRSTFTVANLAHDSLPELDELHRLILDELLRMRRER